MRTRIKAVLFDLDDTLFDRQRTQSAVLELIFREFPDLLAGLDRQAVVNAFFVSDNVANEVFQAGGSQQVVRYTRSEAFLQLLDLPEKHAGNITELYTENYPNLGQPVDGAKSVLTRLAGKYRLGLVSNGFPDTQLRKLAALGLTDMFTCLAFSMELGVSKPDPRIFLHAAEQLSRPAEKCLFIGDSYENDIAGARKAGMVSCWYNPQGLRLLPKQKKPDFEIASLKTLIRILRVDK